MAIKDWKIIRRTKVGEIVWRNEKKDINVGVYRPSSYPARNDGWDVDIDFSLNNVKTKRFKTKSGALKYAKQYMRKH